MTQAVNSRSNGKGEPAKVFTIGRNPKTLVEVSIYGTKTGRYMAAFYDAGGKRIRIERPTLADAESAARDYVAKYISPEALERELIDSKAAKIVHPVDLITACTEYAEAKKLLLPFNAALLDAVRVYVAQKAESQRSFAANKAVDHFLEHFKGREKTEKANRTYLSRIKKDWGDILLCDVDHVYINNWIESIDASERSRRNYYDAASLLFRYSKKKGWYPREKKSPTELGSRPKAGKPQVKIFTPEEGLAILKAAKDLKSPAYPVIILVGWAACRTEEIAPEFNDKGRINWEDIRWKDQYAEEAEEDRPSEDQIHVTEEAAKSTQGTVFHRYITLSPNVVQMLQPFRNLSGPIYPAPLPAITKEFDRVAKRAKVKWERNALRHSFGTYRVAVTKNVPAVTHDMGNTIAMVQRHYDSGKPAHIGRKWFRIVA